MVVYLGRQNGPATPATTDCVLITPWSAPSGTHVALGQTGYRPYRLPAVPLTGRHPVPPGLVRVVCRLAGDPCRHADCDTDEFEVLVPPSGILGPPLTNVESSVAGTASAVSIASSRCPAIQSSFSMFPHGASTRSGVQKLEHINQGRVCPHRCCFGLTLGLAPAARRRLRNGRRPTIPLSARR